MKRWEGLEWRNCLIKWISVRDKWWTVGGPHFLIDLLAGEIVALFSFVFHISVEISYKSRKEQCENGKDIEFK